MSEQSTWMGEYISLHELSFELSYCLNYSFLLERDHGRGGVGVGKDWNFMRTDKRRQDAVYFSPTQGELIRMELGGCVSPPSL